MFLYVIILCLFIYMHIVYTYYIISLRMLIFCFDPTRARTHDLPHLKLWTGIHCITFIHRNLKINHEKLNFVYIKIGHVTKNGRGEKQKINVQWRQRKQNCIPSQESEGSCISYMCVGNINFVSVSKIFGVNFGQRGTFYLHFIINKYYLKLSNNLNQYLI